MKLTEFFNERTQDLHNLYKENKRSFDALLKEQRELTRVANKIADRFNEELQSQISKAEPVFKIGDNVSALHSGKRRNGHIVAIVKNTKHGYFHCGYHNLRTRKVEPFHYVIATPRNKFLIVTEASSIKLLKAQN